MTEPLRRCHKCGHVAYRFSPCHMCALFAAREVIVQPDVDLAVSA